MAGYQAWCILRFSDGCDNVLRRFSITYFTKGAGVNTLSTMIYTQLRKGIIPEMYALSTILFFLALVLLLIMNYRSVKDVKGRS